MIEECLQGWAKIFCHTCACGLVQAEITQFSEKKSLGSLCSLWLSPRDWTLFRIEDGYILYGG